MKRLLLVVVLATVSWSGCKGFETNLQDTNVDYLADAEENFRAGEAAFEEKKYNQAIKFFEYVKNKFPYSQFSALSELRIADAYFAREEWLAAADAYRVFVKFHPRHEAVSHATFRIGAAYAEESLGMAASGNERLAELAEIFSPFAPAWERDQASTVDAVQALDDYLTRYPDGADVEAARALRVKARTRLAAHDLYAAEFYEARRRYRGALWRYQRIADIYGDTPTAKTALLRAADIARDELEDPQAERSVLSRIVEKLPDTDEARAAQLRLDALTAQATPDAASSDTKDEE